MSGKLLGKNYIKGRKNLDNITNFDTSVTKSYTVREIQKRSWEIFGN